MPRKTLAILVPVLLAVVVLALVGMWGGFWGTTVTGPRNTVGIDEAEPGYTPNTSRPPATSAIPPSRIDRSGGETNPVPSGTPDVQDRTLPPSALPRAPSGEPALLDRAPPAAR